VTRAKPKINGRPHAAAWTFGRRPKRQQHAVLPTLNWQPRAQHAVCMARITHRLFGSVFTKILAVILLAGLGIQMAVGIFFWYFRAKPAGNTARPSLTI